MVNVEALSAAWQATMAMMLLPEEYVTAPLSVSVAEVIVAPWAMVTLVNLNPAVPAVPPSPTTEILFVVKPSGESSLLLAQVSSLDAPT